MKIAQLTPGTGSFYCGSCLRDHTATKALQKIGHDAYMVPFYLPFALETPEQDARSGIFMGGVNLYLQHKFPALKKLPRLVGRVFDGVGFLRWSSKRGDMTDASQLGELALATIGGNAGNQPREMERLVEWMKDDGLPDVLVLSNVMLAGLVPHLRAELDVPIICTLHGEDTFLDRLPSPCREQAWATLKDRVSAIDHFVAVSRYYQQTMQARLDIPAENISYIHNGIDLTDYANHQRQPFDTESPLTIGYLARMCEDKGIHTLIEAFIELKQRDTIPRLRLHADGVVLNADQKLLTTLQEKIADAGHADDVRFRANVERHDKLEMLHSVDILAVPALYGESFGLYVIEALAAGTPVVQPRHAAFPEIVEATGGGVLHEPNDATALADALEYLLLNHDRRLAMGERGRQAVQENFSDRRMAVQLADLYCNVIDRKRLIQQESQDIESTGRIEDQTEPTHAI